MSFLGKLNNFRMGFNLKLLFTLFSILIGFAVSLGLVFSWMQRQTLKEHMVKEGEIIISMLSESLQAPLYFEDRVRVVLVVDSLFQMGLADGLKAVAIYDKDEKTVSRRFVDTSESSNANPPESAAMDQAMKGYGLNPEQTSVWENDEVLIFTAPIFITSNDGSGESLYFDKAPSSQSRTMIGVLQVAVGLDHFHSEVRKTAIHTANLTALFLVFALLATFLLTRSTMAPLRRLVTSIRSRGMGDGAYDEMGLLGDTFSQLIFELETSFNTIRDLQSGLEKTVEERTHDLKLALEELKETHAQLAQSEKMVAIGRLVAGVAHEINNTTNFISGALPPLRKRITELEKLSLLPQEEEPDRERCAAIISSVKVLLENVSEGARRTNKIVGDLKSFSRPADEELVSVDVNQCLRSTCTLAYPEYKYRIELDFQLAEDLPMVEGVQGQLNQVFMNLLLNAFQAQTEKGVLTLQTWADGEAVHVLFRDNGPGIPDHVIGRIFEPFFTTKTVGKGTGLGLSISYGIIQKHQGQILVRSVLGQGSEFEVILPFKRRPQEQTSPESGE